MDTSVLEDIHHVFNPILFIFGLFIIIINSLIIYIIIAKFTDRNTEIKLTFILCVIECIQGLGLAAWAIAKLIVGYTWFESYSIQCIIEATIEQTTLRFGLFTLAILSTMRYLKVCHKKEKSFKFWITIWLIVISPFIALLFDIPINQDAAHSSSWLFCLALVNPGTAYSVLNAIIPFSLLIPCWVITFCYCSIGYTANKQLNQIRSQAISENNTSLLLVVKKQKLKLVIQILVIFIVYNFNYMLSYITLILKYLYGYRRPPILDAITCVFFNEPAAVNPLITITFQPELNNELYLLLLKFQIKVKSLFKRIFSNIQSVRET